MPIVGIAASSRRTVPDAPTIGTATNVGSGRAYNNGRADVTFSAPVFNGGFAITSYTVTAVEDVTKTASGASSPLSVTGLASGTNYTFKAYATNSIGTSVGSVTSNQITASTVPQTPTAPTVSVPMGQVFAANANVSVTVNPQATGGSPITNYAATSSSTNTQSSGTNPVLISDQRGVARTYTSTVTNTNGTSSASPASASATPTTVPQAPTIGTASASAGSASVPYTAGSDGGLAVTTFTATSTPDSRTGTGASPITVSSLTNGTSYTFKVKATNANGTSLESGASNPVTPVSAFSFSAFGFYAPPIFSFGGAYFGPPPGGGGGYGFSAPWGNSIDVQTKIQTPNGLKYAGDIKVGDVVLGLNIPSDMDEEDWIMWSSNPENFESNVAETTVTSVLVHLGSEYVYIDGDLFTPSHYILTKKDNTIEYVKADLINVTYQRYSYEALDFVDIEIVEDILVEHNNISIHCEPHDNFFTEQMLVLESLPH
jgi:hypothetical protein